jgi:hypothetical protein
MQSTIFSGEKQSINPITGFIREIKGRKTKDSFCHDIHIAWCIEDSRHFWRKAKSKNSKRKTLRTHRKGV